jgi:ubiquinone/menaquinone biosynthesis C-methylase UbiE
MSYKKTAELYNERYLKYGNSIETVGWGSKKDQFLRFNVLFRNVNPNNKKILDIGCGFGDCIEFLNEKTAGNFDYTGIDIAEELISEAKRNHLSENRKFYKSDVFSIKENFDIVIMSGALSHKVEGILDYTLKSLKKMFEISNELVSVNFLSKYVDYELEKNQHYYPEEILKECNKFCKKMNLLCDYPLHEFTIQLKK